MAYVIPEDLSIPEFLRRGPKPAAPMVPPALSAPAAGYTPNFNLVGKPYGTGFNMLPPQFSGNLPAPAGASGLPVGPGGLPPATGQDFKLPVRSLSGDASAVMNYLRSLPGVGTLLGSGAGRGSMLGPVGAAVGTAASVMAPKPAGDANDNGTGTLLSQPTFPNGVPLPRPRPVNYGPEFNEAFGSVPNTAPAFDPMKQANPYPAAVRAGAMAQGNPYPSAPNMSTGNGFGSETPWLSPSNMGQGPNQTDILRQLLAALQGQGK